MRSFATALFFWLFATVAAAQCASPALLKTSLTQDLNGATMPQPLAALHAGQGGIIKTAAMPPSRLAQPTPATGVAQPAPAARMPQQGTAIRKTTATPRGSSAQDTEPSTGRSPGSAALYAVIAVMAAIALRRRAL